MILDNKGTQSDSSDGAEAPPAYDEFEAGERSPGFSSDQKSPRGGGPQVSQAGPSTHEAPEVSTRDQSSRRSRLGKVTGQLRGGTNKNWFSWSIEKDMRKEVKQTIQSLIRDVVKEPTSPAALSVLHSCLEACEKRGLSFQSIVSEKFIEGHCPLYWAIVKRPATTSERREDCVQLLDVLLSIPLDPTTRSEAYLACLLTSDQRLFQRLRHTPGDCSPSVSAADELLLGDAPKDEVRSFDRSGDHGEFCVVWTISQFQKRMRAIGGVGTEVVARGRIWSLAFTILPRDTHSGVHLKAGTWVFSISLLAPSPPAYLDAQLSISEPPSKSLSTPPFDPSLPSRASQPSSSALRDQDAIPALPPPAQIRKNNFAPWSNLQKESHKPPITLRIQTNEAQLQPLALQSEKQDLREHVLSQPGLQTLIVPLNNHANGDSLQFDGSSYVHPDGSLHCVLDGRLARPGTGGDCVIC